MLTAVVAGSLAAASPLVTHDLAASVRSTAAVERVVTAAPTANAWTDRQGRKTPTEADLLAR
jgi:hypothetical protein